MMGFGGHVETLKRPETKTGEETTKIEKETEKENAKLVTYNITGHKHHKQHSKHS